MEYRHGGDVYSNQGVFCDYSININPLGMPDFIKNAAIRGIESSSRYPDSRCLRLTDRVSSAYGTDPKTLIFGNGAAELIFAVCRAVRPKRAVLLAPSFTEYESALQAIGAECTYFYLKEEQDFWLPIEEYIDFLRQEAPDMIFLCSPSNPVGDMLRPEDVKRIVTFCGEKNIFAVIDECFMELAGADNKASAISLVKNGYRKLMILRAFTKTFAMAGLRLGYGFSADPELLEKMRSSMQPWSVSIPAQEAGYAAFGPEGEEYVKRAVSLIREERRFIENSLPEGAFKKYPSSANYILFRDLTGRPERAFYEYMLRQGILIRCCDDYRGLDGTFYRVCVKKREDNIILEKYIKGYL